MVSAAGWGGSGGREWGSGGCRGNRRELCGLFHLNGRFLPCPPPPPLLPPAGEEVTFSEVVGMTELNGRAPLRVQNCKAHSFHLDVDSTGFQ